ncbi:hypothetical protein GCM10022631_27850 [Deinococcus rubellus]
MLPASFEAQKQYPPPALLSTPGARRPTKGALVGDDQCRFAAWAAPGQGLSRPAREADWYPQMW